MKTSQRRSFIFVCLLSICAVFASSESRAIIALQIGQNFTGSTYLTDSDAVPADANGAAGPSHFVELINGRYSVYDKTNGKRVQTMMDRAFWVNAGIILSTNLDVTDPRIVFDAGPRRWFASAVDLDSLTQVSNRFLLAVSASADPTGSWNGFAFAADPVGGAFADFPTLGVDANGVYLSGDMFDDTGNGLGPTLVAIPKNELLLNPPSIEGRTSFGLLAYDTRGEILQPAVILGPSSTQEDVLAVGDTATDFQPHSTLLNFAIQNTAGPGNATITSSTTLSVPSYSVPINPPQPGGSHSLDNGDARISALVYGVGEVLYGVHSTEVDNRSAIQWFKINRADHTMIQTGTITDSTLDLFYPSIAANASGTVVIGCNGSSSASFVSSYAVLGELANGALTFGSVILLKAGTATYRNPDPTGTSRWGDYSATSVDPTDPNRFWTIQMYPSRRSVWATQITELITSQLDTNQLELNITHIGTDLRISWPNGAAGFQLQFSPSLSPTNTWTVVTESVVTSNNQLAVSLPAASSQGFFRLAKP